MWLKNVEALCLDVCACEWLFMGGCWWDSACLANLWVGEYCWKLLCLDVYAFG